MANVAWSEDKRMLVVEKHFLEGLSIPQIARDVRGSVAGVKKILRRFKHEATAQTRRGRRCDLPSQTVMTEAMDRELIRLVAELDDESTRVRTALQTADGRRPGPRNHSKATHR